MTLVTEKNQMPGIAEFAPEKVAAIVFDIDDTVTRGTQSIKRGVWDQMFAEQLDKLSEARELYEATGKGDRYNMIAHIIGEPQEGCRENEQVAKIAAEFEEKTQQRIRTQGMHPDDLQAIASLQKKYPGRLLLLSATPQAAVEGNVRYFEDQYPELRGVFAVIIGTPMESGKAGELTKIARKNNLEVDELLMVGDGGSDHNGAAGAGTQFVGVIPEGKNDKWSDENFPKIRSIADLPDLLETEKTGPN